MYTSTANEPTLQMHAVFASEVSTDKLTYAVVIEIFVFVILIKISRKNAKALEPELHACLLLKQQHTMGGNLHCYNNNNHLRPPPTKKGHACHGA